MAQPVRTPLPEHVIRRRNELYSVLDDICRDLELGETQYNAARISYESVSDWMSKSEHPVLRNLSLYCHGSTALGTTVKPLGREDFDVDLICLINGLTYALPPAEIKKLVGDRLRENATYAAMLEEKKRCWRLNYAREFHLDISPTVPNPDCPNGGELVPDRNLRAWKPTNPYGYRKWFEERCALQPRLRTRAVEVTDALAKADIEAFPRRQIRKGILRRIVQLLKRHRDVFFFETQEEVAPISIVITTLAANAYELCTRQFTFETELEIVNATIRLMPHFIEKTMVDGKPVFWVPNPTTLGENFADRWNSQPARIKAFYGWHQQALEDFENIETTEGLDLLTQRLSLAFGERVVRKVMDARTDTLSIARASQKLFVVPGAGLSLVNSANAAPIPKNTHFGDGG